MVLERRVLVKNNDRRQISSEVKPGRAGLVFGWVSTFKQKPLCVFLIDLYFAGYSHHLRKRYFPVEKELFRSCY